MSRTLCEDEGPVRYSCKFRDVVADNAHGTPCLGRKSLENLVRMVSLHEVQHGPPLIDEQN